MNFVNEKQLIHPTQNGFMPGNRMTDHILTLKTIQDKYMLNRVRKKKSMHVLLTLEKLLTLFGNKAYFTNLL